MFRLAAVLWVLIATVFAGSAVTALLSLNMLDASKIAGAAIAGAVVALPVAWVLGKKIYSAINGNPA